MPDVQKVGGRRAQGKGLPGKFLGSPATGSRTSKAVWPAVQRASGVHSVAAGNRDGASSILLWHLSALRAAYLP